MKVVWPFLAGAVLMVALSAFSVNILSAARAYVEGESLWSKAQKEAVFHLSRYAYSGDEVDFQYYRQAITVNLGDRNARLELDQPAYDADVARQGFLEGRNHPDDIDGMIWLFRNFRHVSFMRKPISIWAEADGLIEELIREADILHAAIVSGTLSPSSRLASLKQIERINGRLTPLEDAFSYSLGEASRKIRELLLFTVLAITVALIGFGSYLSYYVLARKESTEKQLRILAGQAAAQRERREANGRLRDQAALLDKAREDDIRQLAFYDPLTKLPNRLLLQDRLQQALAFSAHSQVAGALLFIDLDNFKALNDTLGHEKGDLLLQQVAQRLASCLRESDTVARLGGDEFVIILSDLHDGSENVAIRTRAICEKILEQLRQPYLIAGDEQHSAASIGVALFQGRQNTVSELLKRADLAMYQAKAAGRNTVRFFNQNMQAAVNARATLEADLRNGLRESQFRLYYQPQMDEDGQMIGTEALLRWQHPTHGLVLPARFISVSEETALILPLGLWVLKTACAQLALWAGNPSTARLTVAVNVSARQFHHEHFVAQLLKTLDDSGADPKKLKLEITESLLLDDVEATIVKMARLKAEGVTFSLDDFGTGYSSLSYLKHLPLDQLKIDQSFVRDVLVDYKDAAIARTIVTLAQSLGLAVIAEGVESEGQRNFLARHDCHLYQGYLFSRPLPIDRLEALLSVH